jgi:uncharacterized protein with HEPN domain
MSKREWKLFVEDILESINLIEKYIEGVEEKDFNSDRKTIDAVVRNLEIIGEAAKYIPEDVKYKFSDVDWKGVLGLRNRIAHEYFGISVSIIWDIITKELPLLKEQMEKVLKD